MKEWLARLKEKPAIAHAAARGRAIQQPAGRSVRRRHHLLLGAGHHSHHVVRLRRARLCLDRAPAGPDRRCHGPGVRGARRTRSGHRAEDQRPDQQHAEQLERRRDRRPALGDLLRRGLDGQSEERRTRPVAARLRPPGGPGQHRQEDPGQPADPGRPAGPDRHHRWVGEPVHEPVRRSGQPGWDSARWAGCSRCCSSRRWSSRSVPGGCCSCISTPCSPRTGSPGGSSGGGR